MTAFAYDAVDASGKMQRGVMEAASAAAARAMLREAKLLPVHVRATHGGGDGDNARAKRGGAFGSFALPRPGRKRIGTKQLATFTRQLATLIGSNVAIEEALRLTAAQAEQNRVRSLILEVRGAILDGHSLAHALGLRPADFPEFYRASVAAGEQSGTLAHVLTHLAAFVELRRRNQQKIQLALLYPALLSLLSLGMIAMLLVYVVPDIVRVFVSRGTDLPFLTRALIALSEGVQGYGPYLLLALLVFGFVARRWLAVPANRVRVDAALVRYPPFARFSRQNNAARFAGSLATLIQSAVPLVDALRAAAAVTPNRYMRGKVLEVEQHVREGASLNGAMREAAVFPPMLVAIVASGENGGTLGVSLSRAATELEEELDALTATLVGLVEPLVLLMMGGIVLLMVLAILLPIINLNDLATM